MATRLITFLSDFGLQDPYVGEVKAVLLGYRRPLSIVDLGHDNPAFDIQWGAFQLLRSYHYFPEGTIHLAVIDPGVGSARRAIYVKTRRYHFVGPDNGLLRWAVEDAAKRDNKAPSLFEIPVPQRIAPTFHGRDLFAPFIVRLLKKKRAKLRRIEHLEGEPFPEGGKILGFDRYGNAITSLRFDDRLLGEIAIDGIATSVTVVENYHALPRGGCGAVHGSHGFFEIAASESSAREKLKLQRGMSVTRRL